MINARTLIVTACLLAIAASANGKAADTPDQPKLMSRKAPLYPRAAAREKINGCVVVAFDVTLDGLADNYQIMDSNPPGIFDKTTLASLSSWRFETPSTVRRYWTRLDFSVEKAPQAKKLARDCVSPSDIEQLAPIEAAP